MSDARDKLFLHIHKIDEKMRYWTRLCMIAYAVIVLAVIIDFATLGLVALALQIACAIRFFWLTKGVRKSLRQAFYTKETSP